MPAAGTGTEMTAADQTTPGYEAAPSQVQALLENLCGDLLAEPDWLSRYTALTEEQALVDALVSAIKRERGKALASGRECGLTLDGIAEAVHLGTRQRVQQLLAATADHCCHVGCTRGMAIVAGGLGYCSVDHVPAELRGTVQ
jgi:hypothetical protein